MVQRISTILIMALLTAHGTSAKEKPATVIVHEFTINADISKAWEVLGKNFVEAQKWAAAVNYSEARDHQPFNGSSCTERGCNVSGIGDIKEKLLQFSEQDHVVSYQIYEGMPGMVKFASNTWQLTPLGGGKTKLTMSAELKLGGFMGWMMKGMMLKNMRKLTRETGEEFLYYVENGKPHPRKVKAAEKFAKKKK